MTGDQPAAAGDMRAAIARAQAHSPFLAAAMRKLPAITDRLGAGDLTTALALARKTDELDRPLAQRLRRERLGIALAVAIGDLGGVLSLEQVTAILSDFADRALDRAIRAAIAERTPGAEPLGFVALALGKHGSRELNYSSDIDPILLFDPETLPRRPREDPDEAAVRIARRVVDLLQTRDADGYVLRVDLRLRPSPEATAIAVPAEAAISYYESLALPWERAAFIRARAAAGDLGLGERLLAALQPFVWRRALDFGAIGEIRAISQRIRSHHRGQVVGPGYDIKRGRGGIREIEFFAQVHQLIHGGRMPALRAPATLDALAALATAGIVPEEDARTLGDAYRCHRTIEHRFQMVEDQQTHRVPEAAAAIDNVAALAGFADGAALLDRVAGHARPVGRLYDALEQGTEPRLPEEPAALCRELQRFGFPEPPRAAEIVAAWRAGQVPSTRSVAAREGLEAMLPAFLPALGRAADPMTALARFDDLVRRVPSALNLFRLIQARPLLGTMLADILGVAPALAEALSQRPVLLDGFIDATAFTSVPALGDLVQRWRQADGEDYARHLERVRAEVGEWRFRLGAQLVLGAGDGLAVAAGYARLAEAAVAVLGASTVGEFERSHGRVPGGELVIVALGRLGGAALTHASDLDLVYLFTGDFLAQSDGAKPLGATLYFNRLAQRVTAALSVPTAAGPLYPVDTRLRPSGAQGLLAVSLDSFARYQAENAWTWEHLALTRARPIFGSAGAQAEVAAAVRETLGRRRDPARLRAEAVRMRGEIARHKPPAGPFDVKLLPGGLVDLEFTVQVRQLEHGIGLSPQLGEAIAALAAAGLVPPALGPAHDLLTRLLVAIRLVVPGGEQPGEPARTVLARACGEADWASLLAALAQARQSVAEAWSQITASTGEQG